MLHEIISQKKKAGGSRPGSGRPKGSGKYKEATCPIRIPNSLLPEVRDLLSQYEGLLSRGTETSGGTLTSSEALSGESLPKASSLSLVNSNAELSRQLSNKKYSELPLKDYANIYEAVSGHRKQALPLYGTRVAAGFPSPADDYIETKLDLNQYLVKHPAATFFVRVEGDSMIGAGIHPDDILVIDRSIKPTDGKIVIAVVNGELTVKRLRILPNYVVLQPENDKFSPIRVTEEMNFSIWGVVTSVIHSL